jgi:hypothetical protein
VVDPRKPNVFKWCLAQNLKDAVVRRLRRKPTGADVFQEELYFRTGHSADERGACVDFNSSRALTCPVVLFDGFILL